MLATSHVLAGALIGRAVRRPVPAYLVGVASHLAMDALPHWGIDLRAPGATRVFYAVASVDGLCLSAVLAGLVRSGRPTAEVAGALGGLTLDLDKPAATLGVRQLWPDPVHRVHQVVQWESPRRWWVEVVGVAALAAAVRATR